MGGIEYELVYLFEYLIDLIVVAPIVPPPFNHSVVITVNEEVGVVLPLWDKDPDEVSHLLLCIDCHAHQWLPMVMVMKNPELTSENALMFVSVTGLGMGQLRIG